MELAVKRMGSAMIALRRGVLLRCVVALGGVLLGTAGGAFAQDTAAKTLFNKGPDKQSVKELVAQLFTDVDEIELMSHNGKWIGTDNDLTLQLRRDGSVTITQYGFGVSTSVGKYIVRDDGTLVVTPAGPMSWLPMPCKIVKGRLVVLPPDMELCFQLCRWFGVPEHELTDENFLISYDRWPLRQIEPKSRASKRPESESKASLQNSGKSIPSGGCQ